MHFRRSRATATDLAVPSSPDVKTLAQYLALARQSPTPLTVGSPGQGSGAHFYSELLAQASGVQLTHVPYRGEVPLLPKLLSGLLSAGWISGNLVTQYLGEGRIQVLGVGSVKKRTAALPDVQAKVKSFGFEPPRATNRAQFQAVMRGTHEGWARAIQTANIKLE